MTVSSCVRHGDETSVPLWSSRRTKHFLKSYTSSFSFQIAILEAVNKDNAENKMCLKFTFFFSLHDYIRRSIQVNAK